MQVFKCPSDNRICLNQILDKMVQKLSVDLVSILYFHLLFLKNFFISFIDSSSPILG